MTPIHAQGAQNCLQLLPLEMLEVVTQQVIQVDPERALGTCAILALIAKKALVCDHQVAEKLKEDYQLKELRMSTTPRALQLLPKAFRKSLSSTLFCYRHIEKLYMDNKGGKGMTLEQNSLDSIAS